MAIRRFKKILKKGILEMVLNTKQEQGLKVAVERYRNNEKYTVISGYA